MEWQKLIGFYHVAKLGSFTRAAEATFRTQSALTQQIKALEDELGCELFERIGKRKIVLTPAGEKLFRFSETLLRNYEKIREEIAEYAGAKKGWLRIAAPFTTLYHLLPELIQKYNRKFRWVELSLLDRSQKEAVEMVRSGEVDFGIALEGMIPMQLHKQRWKKVEPVLLVQSGHPLTKKNKVILREIAECPLILPPKSSGYLYRSTIEELFRRHDLNFVVIMESSNIELSSLYVEMGLGVSFASIVKDLPVLKKKKVEFISLSHLLPTDYICIATRKDKHLTSYQQSFLDMLLSA